MDNIIIVAMKAVITYNNKALIIQRSKENRINPETWECAGGKLEFGETLEEGLKREISEETGLKVTIEKVLYAISFKTHDYRQVVVINYLCNCEGNKVILSGEHQAYHWASKKMMKALLFKDIITNFEENKVFEQLNIDEE